MKVVRDLRCSGLDGTETASTDGLAGRPASTPGILPRAGLRCRFAHFILNEMDHMPLGRDDDCLRDLCRVQGRDGLEEGGSDIAARPTRWPARRPKLTARAEGGIEAKQAICGLPSGDSRHLKSITRRSASIG